jgi:hypothetical protein
LTVVESDKAERAGQIRILVLERADRAKRLATISEVCEHAAVSIIHEKETFHRVPLSSHLRF